MTDWREHHCFMPFDGWCGVATVKTVLSSCGIKKSCKIIAKDILKEWYGVPHDLMVAYLSRFFNLVNYKTNATIEDISFHLKKGNIVVVNFWDNFSEGAEGEGHYAIVAKCQKGTITLVDSSAARKGIWKLPTKEFNERWYDTIDIANKIYIEGWMLWLDPKTKKEKYR